MVALIWGKVPTWINCYWSGNGYGNGSGYGNGYGDGSGYGDGYGNGYGNGSGDGYGDGYGDGSYWSATVRGFASKWPLAQRTRIAELVKSGARIAFWRSDAHGQPANNGQPVEAAAPGVIHTAPGPLKLCKPGTLHATLIPPRWRGERWWIVALHGEVVGNDEKMGCLKREILGECL